MRGKNGTLCLAAAVLCRVAQVGKDLPDDRIQPQPNRT